MSKIRTFIDSGVLIVAAHGMGQQALHAGMILNDPNREYLSSVFVKLEVLPKPRYFKLSAEVNFYEAFFAAVQEWADPAAVIDRAFADACRFGLSAIDALHVAAAAHLSADELITTEGLTKPIHRATGVKVLSI